MTTTTHDPTELVLPPYPCPFGAGNAFEVIVRSDVKSFHGNVSVLAGRYVARFAIDSSPGCVVIWSPHHYASETGMWVTLSTQDWTFPGEPSRAIPDHECLNPDTLRSGVAGGIFCGVCRKEVDL